MKVYLDTIGCRLNQSEIENYGRQFRAVGHELVATMDAAEMMVLNTCAVTASASSDSRQKIRQANRAGIEQIVVTGCMSTLAPDKTATMSGVTRVVPNPDKDRLVEDLLGIEIPEFELEPISREPIPGSRSRTRAFIKVQDGCDNKCTFCITTVARGEGRSRTEMEIIADIRAAIKGGVQEVVLTGVHLGSWGYDFEQPSHLKNLIPQILKLTDVPRLRISSLEPWDLDETFFDLWQDPRLCRHLHLPLQSGSAGTLRRMARKVTPTSYASLLAAARERIAGVAITTDIIAGFPGETETEFEETCDFVESMNFAGAHVFTYSEREGTAAANMPDQVHNYLRKERSTRMRKITEKAAAAYRAKFIGQEINVLWENSITQNNGSWKSHGLTDNYLRVEANAPQPIWNQITPTRITRLNGHGLFGEIAALPNTILLD